MDEKDENSEAFIKDHSLENNDCGNKDEQERYLLLRVTILEIKYFLSVMAFLEKTTKYTNIKFTKAGMQGIQVITNEKSPKDSVDNVSSFVIPHYKLYNYECNTQNFSDFDEKSPNDSFFRLRFILRELCETLGDFKVEDTLVITYYKGDKYATLINESTNSETEITVRYSEKNLTIPIDDPIISPSFPLFMNIISRRYCEITSRMTKKKEKLANKMYIRIRDDKKKGLCFSSSEPGVFKNFGDYSSNREPSFSFKLNSQLMKYLSYFTKGNERGFLEFRFNGNLIKFSINLGSYLRHDFIVVSKVIK